MKQKRPRKELQPVGSDVHRELRAVFGPPKTGARREPPKRNALGRTVAEVIERERRR